MAKTKRLSPSQVCALKVLDQGRASYFDIARAGGNGKTISSLVDAGLATKITHKDGSNEWEITKAGRDAFEAGRYPLAEA